MEDPEMNRRVVQVLLLVVLALLTLPGAPDGEYVVFQFNTSFEQKSAAVETVTAIREKDGT
jgi:hypothetical protein